MLVLSTNLFIYVHVCDLWAHKELGFSARVNAGVTFVLSIEIAKLILRIELVLTYMRCVDRAVLVLF